MRTRRKRIQLINYVASTWLIITVLFEEKVEDSLTKLRENIKNIKLVSKSIED